MNLILLHAEEAKRDYLAGTDPRYLHICTVLGRTRGEKVCVGLINGPRGIATLTEISKDWLRWEIAWCQPHPAPMDLILLAGLPRPQSARRLLREGAALGITRFLFFSGEKSEASFRSSRLWTGDEFHKLLEEGIAQAFCTHLPQVEIENGLSEAIGRLSRTTEKRIALDNYESARALGVVECPREEVCLAIGPERGWSRQERTLLQQAGFVFYHLGARVLRSDTAALIGAGVLRAKRGDWEEGPTPSMNVAAISP